MKFLFDFFPVLLFFGVYEWGDRYKSAAQSLAQSALGDMVTGGVVSASQAPIMLATVAAMLATLCQILYLVARKRKIDGLLWVSAGVIAVMGSMTIYFNNENFIKWKPTILYWCTSAMFLISQLFLKKNLARSMMGQIFVMPEPLWVRVSLLWAGFFALLGALNLYVAFHFETATWVKFKLIGGTGLMFLFIFGQGLLLSKYLKEEPETAEKEGKK